MAMHLFDVYPLFKNEPVSAKGSIITDRDGTEYLDFYGGHAVISIGHSHPHYVERLTAQLNRIGFYSNAVQNPLQEKLAAQLGKFSGYEDYALFLCNSGAEANENALKLASFHNGRKKIIAFQGSFHGRTSAAVAVTDDSKLKAPVNHQHEVVFLPLNERTALLEAMDETVCAVIIEGMQGVAGVHVPEDNFLREVERLCRATGTLLILDEVQSGYGRSGKFFAHQHAGVRPDLITVAKGMGNGFPVAGVIIAPHIKAKHGLLGTTFGGNYLACTAALAVLDVLEQEKLLRNAALIGDYLVHSLTGVPGVKAVRGRGLMIGIELEWNAARLRKTLLEKHHIFTGSASCPRTLRLLPALNITKAEADRFIEAFVAVLKTVTSTPIPS